jgi:hypothetical protein
MFKLMAWIIKVTVFAAIVLVLGNVVKWHGRTVSDQIKTQVSHAEQTPWGERAQDLLNSPSYLSSTNKASGRHSVNTANSAHPLTDEKISPTEQQKLKALIRELNGSRSHD